MPDWVFMIRCSLSAVRSYDLHGHGGVYGSRTVGGRSRRQAVGLDPQPCDDSPTDGWGTGTASDIEITAREIQKLKKELYTIIAEHSHTDFDKVWADSDRDYWMTAQEAKEYGRDR